MAGKVLVPVDGSEVSDRILSFVDRLPDRGGLELVLAQVLTATDDRDACADAVQHVVQVADRMAQTGARAVPLITRGEDPAEAILHLVDLVRPDLVAMAAQGRGETDAVRGDVAEKVLTRCPVPLFVGTAQVLPIDPGAGFAKILVPLDDTATSARILDHVAGLARYHGSEVLLLTVDTLDTPDDVLEKSLLPYRERLLQGDVERVRIITARGDEATQILDTAENEGVDLLAMTSHAHPDPKGRWFGSVSQEVMRLCTTPVLLVRIPKG